MLLIITKIGFPVPCGWVTVDQAAFASYFYVKLTTDIGFEMKLYIHRGKVAVVK